MGGFKMKNNRLFVFIFLLTFSFSNSYAQSLGNTEDLTYMVVPIELRLQVKEYVLKKTDIGLEQMVVSARNNEPVPNEMLFLSDIAREIYNGNGMPLPNIMDSRTVLASFASRYEASVAIETYYRNEIFRLFHTNRNEASRQFRINNSEHSVENIFERSKLSFHIVDNAATDVFNSYYRANPATTFDMDGNLINPSIRGIPPDVIILGVFERDPYGIDVQQRNIDGNLSYIAIKREIGLDSDSIRSALVEKSSIDGRPEVTFMLDDEASDTFYLLTSANIGNVMAIVLDGKIRCQATIQSVIIDAVKISGFDIEEAELIAQMLRNR